ncbi:MAG: hypothetical protein ACRC50_11915 [Gaiella sp.]
MTESALPDRAAPQAAEEAPLVVPPPVTEATKADRARATGYRKRFAILYLALGVLGGAAVGATIVLLARPDAGPAPSWSAWEPTGSDSAKTKQIADRVARTYRLPSGQQLAIALAGPPTVSAGDAESTANIPVRAIAVRPDTSTGQAEEDDIAIVDAKSSFQYVLCGLGPSCSIASGAPSEARHALLRRQAVELALYTFKYVPSIETVTVFLPPRPDGAAPPNAVFISRSDVKQELGQPLFKTLEPTTPGIDQLRGRELAAVNRITRPRLYQFEYTQAQDGSAVLVLNPIVASS